MQMCKCLCISTTQTHAHSHAYNLACTQARTYVPVRMLHYIYLQVFRFIHNNGGFVSIPQSVHPLLSVLLGRKFQDIESVHLDGLRIELELSYLGVNFWLI